MSVAAAEISGVAATLPPAAPASPIPVSGATSVAPTAALSWAASAGATQYDVAFGLTNPPAIVSSNQTTTTYQPSALAPGATYYWQVVAKSVDGSTSGPIWSLTTAVPGSLVLVAAYNFDEGAGTTTGDVTGNGRVGTLSNTTWTAAGKHGGALSFNGTSALVTVADTAALHFSSGMTLEAWVNPAGTGAPSWQAIIHGDPGYFLSTNGSATPTAGVIVGGVLSRVTSPTDIAVNTWTHLAATYDGTTARLFVNGTLVSSLPASGLADAAQTPVEVGGSLVGGGWFTGLIDDVRLYNSALTQAQIQTDMAIGVGSDTQAPTAPTALAVLATSPTQLTVTWTASTDTVGVTGYRVERCLGAACTTFSQVGTPSTPTYSDAGLVAVTSYTYRVRATDAAGNLSSYSSAVSGTTLTPPPAPTPPANPNPVSAATGVVVPPTLSWAPSTNATQYDVAVGLTPSPAVVSSNQTATSYAPAALIAGTTYYWQVVAKGPGGATSGPVWTFATAPAPAAPASPSPVSAATGVPLTPTLSWAPSANATQYTWRSARPVRPPSSRATRRRRPISRPR